jgi:hypothetical protein
MNIRVAVVTLATTLLSCAIANSQETVRISPGEQGLAILIAPAQPRASVILVAGGDGVLGIQPNGAISSLQGNQLVRTRAEYANNGVASLTVDRGVNLATAVQYMRKVAEPVVVVGTSRGSLRTAQLVASASGRGRPDAIVLTAGYYVEGAGPATVQGIVKSPGRLPATLLVHNRYDQCRETPPAGVEEMQRWGGQRVQVVWIDSTGGGGPPCQAQSPHGFAGADAQVVQTIAQYAASVR